MISVIVPIYHGRKYVKTVIGMIERNAAVVNERVELLFVVDNPVENIIDLSKSEKIVVRVINNEQNKGIHYSRVQGLLRAEGEYILMLDQDDEIDDNFLASQLSKIKNADMIVANGYEELKNGRRVLYKFGLMQWTVKYNIFYTLFGCRIISPGQCLLRRESIPKTWCKNIVKENGADDYFLWILLINRKAKIRINRAPLYIHKFTGDNVSGDLEKMNASVREVLAIARRNGTINLATYDFVMSRVNGNRSVLQRVLEGIVKVGNRINGQ